MKFYQNLQMELKNTFLAHSHTFCQKSTKLPWNTICILHLELYMEWLSSYLRCINLPRASTSRDFPYVFFFMIFFIKAYVVGTRVNTHMSHKQIRSKCVTYPYNCNVCVQLYAYVTHHNVNVLRLRTTVRTCNKGTS